ncbi:MULTISPECIES: hypothetical protein [Natrialbaceae]|uniref:hypothetical protein n=2 Tax=Halobacteriales TaxID=2235 RepID=UPI00207C57DF|nr:hypothetical protein [Natronococcus sp. CG52]
MTNTHTKRSQLTTVLMACIVAISMLAAGAPAAMAGDTTNTDADSKTLHALEDGEELYLVFGADLGEQSLEEFLDAHVTDNPGATAEGQEAVSDVVQYQNVEQVNINEQGMATSISIDGGEATAVQEASQLNSNVQEGVATSENQEGQIQETQFEDVGDVYLVMGNGDSQEFNGWGVNDTKGDKNELTASQEAQAAVTQAQNVSQANVNEQSTAFALAANDSEATALQQTAQSNYNLQDGAANASNVYLGDGKFSDKPKKGTSGADASQSASSVVEQGQDVEQVNVNEQGAAVAIAIGENSTATAIQITEQTNINEQLGSAEAVNVLASMPGMNVASAGNGGDVVSTQGSTTGGDDTKADKNGISQEATSEVTQGQAVEQLNVNLQNTAMAIATNDSDATAVQWAQQQNVNAQIGYASALNVYAGPSYAHDDVTQTKSTSVTVDGNDIEGAAGMSYDYDTANGDQTHDVDQYASAEIEQHQFVTQQNINEQQMALAVADDGGSANAAQVSMQQNENVQFTSVAATNVWVAA